MLDKRIGVQNGIPIVQVVSRIAALLWLLALPFASSAGDTNRFIILPLDVSASVDVAVTLKSAIKLDTITGESWLLLPVTTNGVFWMRIGERRP